ncbi:PREDICTED: uncharacterized protein LOC109473290 [Branchiostoma belcheri]|uniref:Uncharacterized protein LOC109473290 n=1 Tax=Branchiostoma belcheri TaxID=7741 RepID=A0A6P4Z465_BRABE|nr:PREDICTED: uncharacterized protein LOC109473290 [Branchiostoma belcheri]
MPVERADTYGLMLVSPKMMTLTRGEWHSLSLDIGFTPCYDRADVPIVASVSSILGLVVLKGIYVHPSIHQCDGTIIRIHITNHSRCEEIVVNAGRAIAQVFFISSNEIGLETRVPEHVIVTNDTVLAKDLPSLVIVEPANRDRAVCRPDEMPILHPLSSTNTLPFLVVPLERITKQHRDIFGMVGFNKNSQDNNNGTTYLKKGSLVACIRFTRLANVDYLWL